ncbi:MAG: hypothetical protein ACD_15C00018G0005 [uncultured bacterium]|nr:MAG: hypothetical protein ACD_15C00018G0005 [uncultured bacterium]
MELMINMILNDMNHLVAQRKFEKFSTNVDLQIILEKDADLNLAERDLDLAKKMLDRFEIIFSRFRQDSELSKINSSIGKFHKIDRELVEVIELSLMYNKKTLGYFDPRILSNLEEIGYDKSFHEVAKNNSPVNVQSIRKDLSEELVLDEDKARFDCKMDFAGIAKGWFVDQISLFLKEKNWKNFVVDIGGDMYFAGQGLEGKWLVGMEGVKYEKMMFSLSDVAIATSGTGKRKWEREGKRFHHLIDPKDAENFSFELKSVTVISGDAVEADIWAKALFLMGKENGMDFANRNAMACVMLDRRGNAFISLEIKKYIFNLDL